MLISWNIPLVLLSVLIAMIGSLTALVHAQRMRSSTGTTAQVWMSVGSITLGATIWSMHFIGMLAFQLPTPVGYDLPLTLLSVLPAIATALLGFFVLNKPDVSIKRIIVSSLLMGAGISTMHYTGMAAIKMSMPISYNLLSIAASILIAIAASLGALLMMYQGDRIRMAPLLRLLLGGIIMGLAISGMHYTAMLGMQIMPGSVCLSYASGIGRAVSAMMVSMIVLFWFSGGIIAALFDQKMDQANVKFYRNILDAAPDATLISDENGIITLANAQAERLLGYKVDELVGQSIEMLVPGRFSAKHPALVAGYKASPVHRTMGTGRAVVALRKDGSEIDVEISLSPVHTKRGFFVESALRDVTERNRLETSLRISAAAFETLHEALMITDANANIIQTNHAFERITGYSQEEVLGKNPRILSSGLHDQAYYSAMWQSLLTDGMWHGEIWDRHKSGNVYPKAATITAVKNKLGETTQYVSIFTDITDHKKSEEEIHNMAFHDALTGLPNRRLLMDRLDVALSVSERSRQYGALIFLDLDNFKLLNDTQGHEAGDLLLIEVANRLKFCVREVDTVARLGGDEFVVLIDNISEDMDEASQNVAQVAEKVRAVLATNYQVKDHSHHSSPSIGVCLFLGNEITIDELVRRADMAMYQAKNSGRNRVQFFDPHLQQSVESHAALESDLRHAINNKQLSLFYQVQVDQNRRPIGAEALIRWNHPKRGLVSPAQFIPIAEESSLILDIGNWVLDTACQQIATWSRHELTRNLVLAVNISAHQFKESDFEAQVTSAIARNDIKPSRLKLELTESMALDNLDPVIAKMRSLRQVGVILSLDDFGTGYSSLSYLKRLPLDQLKIDQSFVCDMQTDGSDAVMIKTIIDLAKNFGLDVIAEGVETEEQLAFLQQHGCLAYQGYLFSKPVPREQFEALLEAGLIIL